MIATALRFTRRVLAPPEPDRRAVLDASRSDRALHPRARLVHGLVVCLLLSVCVALVVHSVLDDAGTSDEFDYIVSGYALLRGIDLHGRVADPVGGSVEQPPLIRVLAALPLQFLSLHLPESSPVPPLPSDVFYTGSPDPDRLLFWARMPMLVLLLLLGLLVERWARRCYGPTAGLFALFLVVFNATLLGNGRFVMMDLAITFFYALAIYSFLRALETPSAGRILAAGVAFGLAQLTKFSALALIPTLLIIAGFHVWQRSGARPRLARLRPALRTVLTVWLIGGVMVAATYSAVVWASTTPESQASNIRELIGDPSTNRQARVVERLTEVSRPLGYYALGLAVLYRHNVRGHASYLYGRVAQSHRGVYFPAAFLLKTQLPLLVLGALAALVVSTRAASFEGRMVLLAAGLYMAVAVFARLNIGVRHLLPLYPLLIVWASQAIRWPQASRRSPVAAAALSVLACWYVYGVVSVHPHYVAYFNELAGGPAGGGAYLSDSNLDIGQDIKRLGTYVHQAGLPDVTVVCANDSELWSCREVHHHIAEAALWDPERRDGPPPPRAGFVAVGKTLPWLTEDTLRRRHAEGLSEWRQFRDRLAHIKPVHTVGHSVDVYYLGTPAAEPSR
jgi:hypothetical protein